MNERENACQWKRETRKTVDIKTERVLRPNCQHKYWLSNDCSRDSALVPIVCVLVYLCFVVQRDLSLSAMVNT